MNSPERSTQYRRIRVFVSSTFRDMHAEREHLVTVALVRNRKVREAFRDGIVCVGIGRYVR